MKNHNLYLFDLLGQWWDPMQYSNSLFGFILKLSYRIFKLLYCMWKILLINTPVDY